MEERDRQTNRGKQTDRQTASQTADFEVYLRSIKVRELLLPRALIIHAVSCFSLESASDKDSSTCKKNINKMKCSFSEQFFFYNNLHLLGKQQQNRREKRLDKTALVTTSLEDCICRYVPIQLLYQSYYTNTVGYSTASPYTT